MTVGLGPMDPVPGSKHGVIEFEMRGSIPGGARGLGELVLLDLLENRSP